MNLTARVRTGQPVGRTDETAEVKRLLAASRLVTLTGIVGVGKSALARHVAAQLRRMFTVSVIDLLHQPVPAAAGQQLLVLDNAEHVLDGCARLCTRLLREHDDRFLSKEVWLYATILTVGYMISRGLAKSGSRQPYDADGSDR